MSQRPGLPQRPAGGRQSLAYRFLALVSLCTLIILVTGLFWEQKAQRRQAEAELLEKNRAMMAEILAVRAVIARNQDRINYDSRGNFEFKHLNPAAVVQQMARHLNESTGYRVKQTRSNPRLPENAPDAWERRALAQFAANPGLREIYGEDTINGKRVFRYIIPLYMQEECLPCHGPPAGARDIAGYRKEGYALGELAGAISLATPMETFEAGLANSVRRNLLVIITLVVLLAGLICAFMYYSVQRPLAWLAAAADRLGRGELELQGSPPAACGEIRAVYEAFLNMAARLKELYSGLEEMVRQRTAALTLANSQLKQQREELERVSQYKSMFLANMGHELRTPLTAIMAFGEMLLGGQTGKLNPVQEEYVRDIYHSARQLLGKINHVLDFAKIEAGKLELKWEDVDVAGVVRAVRQVISPLARQKGLRFTVDLPGTPIGLRADGERLEQILLNLLSNGVKFTPEGGEVRLRVTEQADKVVFEVSDTGVGIAPEEQALVFEPFRQLESGRRRGGTGLGLALTRQLVGLHGGEMTLESAPGKGTTFRVFLPKGGKS